RSQGLREVELAERGVGLGGDLLRGVACVAELPARAARGGRLLRAVAAIRVDAGVRAVARLREREGARVGEVPVRRVGAPGGRALLEGLGHARVEAGVVVLVRMSAED